MKPSDEEFVRRNAGRLSERQMARQLGLSRAEVQRILSTHRPASVPALQKPAGRRFIFLSVIGIWVAAYLIRLAYLWFLKDTPFYAPLAKDIDDGIYDRMAQSLAQGRGLDDFPLLAYRVPLYPYWLAFWYGLFGRNLDGLHGVQSAVGALVPVWVFLISMRWHGQKLASGAAALLALGYAPFFFYDQMLLGESLAIVLSLAALYVWMGAGGTSLGSLGSLTGGGLLMGIAGLLRPNLLMAFPILGLWLLVRGIAARDLKQALLKPAVLAIAAVLAVSPVLVRNYRIYRDIIPVTALAGINLYVGNHPEANGKFSLVSGFGSNFDEMVTRSHQMAEQAAGKTLKPSEASSYWTRQTLQSVTGHFSRWVRLMMLKTSYFFNRYETPDILDIAFVAEFVGFLKGPWVSVWVIVVLAFGALPGGVIFKRDFTSRLILCLTLSGMLSVLAFFVSSRYRLPVIPLLILFAGLGAQRLWTLVRASFRGVTVSEIASVMLAAMLAFWPVEPTNFATNYNSLAIAMKERGEFDRAETYYRKAMEIAPAYPSPYYNLSLLLEKRGRLPEARLLREKFQTLKSGGV